MYQIQKKCGDIGYVTVRKRNSKLTGKPHKLLYEWGLSKNDTIVLRDMMFANSGFSLTRKRIKLFSDFYVPSKRWWTQEQFAILLALYKPWKDGCLQEIAKQTGKSYRAISKKVWELGLCQKPALKLCA